MNAPIRVRLTAWYVLVLALVIAAICVFVVTRLRSDLTSEVDRSLGSAADQIARGYREDGAIEFPDLARSVLPGGAGRAGAQIIDARGDIIVFEGFTADEPLIDAARVARARAGERIGLSDRFGEADFHMRVVAVAVPGRPQGEVLVVAGPLDEVDRSVHRVLILLLVSGTAALGVVAFGGWWIARKALRPVELMTRQADRIGIADLSERIPEPPTRDELGHLARTLNAMLNRLQDGVAARERLIADASHELRAPLTAMRAELEVSLRYDTLDDDARGVLASARDEVVSMGQTVENLLTLARIDEGHLELLVTDEDLHDVAETVVGGFHALARTAGVTASVAGDSVRMPVDRHRIEQVVSNLVDNAVRVSPRGGVVGVTAWQTTDEAGVTVTDDGPGVPADARERIFERFAREDPARERSGGAGLGLSICREIVRAHGGRIHVEPRIPRGSAFVVSLPRAAPPPVHIA